MSDIMTVNDLCLWYGPSQALKDVSINIPEKSVTALIALPAAESPPSSRR